MMPLAEASLAYLPLLLAFWGWVVAAVVVVVVVAVIVAVVLTSGNGEDEGEGAADDHGGLDNHDAKQDQQKCDAGKEISAELVSLTVVQNATQTNVTGPKNWATVKKASDDVIVQATTNPDNLDAWQKIQWAGDGAAVPGKPNQRKLSRATSRPLHVEASLGGKSDHLDVWVIWADLVVTISSSDTIDTGNDASGLAAGHKWPASLGGGNKLGEISCEGTSLTYAYTVGKIQGKATLQPAGIQDVIGHHWHWRRRKTKKAFDNAVLTSSATDANDVTHKGAPLRDKDPKSGISVREIYDLDAPGCSNTKPGTAIDHTAELYENFKQYVAVMLDTEIKCSDDVLWSYEARVDVDKASGKVERNRLRLSHITLPTGSAYTTR